jgi:hypothetical protein
VRLDQFIETVCEERPLTLTGEELAHVHPHPWVTRHGSGKSARIRMSVGKNVWYERRQGEAVWHRVDDGSEFDLLRTA